jgi:hypothetical protein
MARSSGVESRKPRKWSRGDKIATITLIVAILAIAASLMSSELRRFVGLESPAVTTSPQTTINGSASSSTSATGNASTSGAKSPAVTGNGNTITYSHPHKTTQTKSTR